MSLADCRNRLKPCARKVALRDGESIRLRTIGALTDRASRVWDYVFSKTNSYGYI